MEAKTESRGGKFERKPEEKSEERTPTLRLSIPKNGGFQDVEIPIKRRITFFLPKDSHIEMRGKLVDHIRIPVDERRSVFINFGSKEKLGFYASLKLYERTSERG